MADVVLFETNVQTRLYKPTCLQYRACWNLAKATARMVLYCTPIDAAWCFELTETMLMLQC